MPCRTLTDDPKAFPEASGPIAFFGKKRESRCRFNAVEKTTTMFIPRHNRSQKPKVFTTIAPQWRRWSREALFNMIPLISWNCSGPHRTALQPKLSDPYENYRVGGMSRRLRNFASNFWKMFGIRLSQVFGIICISGGHQDLPPGFY